MPARVSGRGLMLPLGGAPGCAPNLVSGPTEGQAPHLGCWDPEAEQGARGLGAPCRPAQAVPGPCRLLQPPSVLRGTAWTRGPEQPWSLCPWSPSTASLLSPVPKQ